MREAFGGIWPGKPLRGNYVSLELRRSRIAAARGRSVVADVKVAAALCRVPSLAAVYGGFAVDAYRAP